MGRKGTEERVRNWLQECQDELIACHEEAGRMRLCDGKGGCNKERPVAWFRYDRNSVRVCKLCRSYLGGLLVSQETTLAAPSPCENCTQ